MKRMPTDGTNFTHGGKINKEERTPVTINKGTIYVTEDILEFLGCDLIRKINNASDDTNIISYKFIQDTKGS